MNQAKQIGPNLNINILFYIKKKEKIEKYMDRISLNFFKKIKTKTQPIIFNSNFFSSRDQTRFEKVI